MTMPSVTRKALANGPSPKRVLRVLGEEGLEVLDAALDEGLEELFGR